MDNHKVMNAQTSDLRPCATKPQASLSNICTKVLWRITIPLEIKIQVANTLANQAFFFHLQLHFCLFERSHVLTPSSEIFRAMVLFRSLPVKGQTPGRKKIGNLVENENSEIPKSQVCFYFFKKKTNTAPRSSRTR